MDADELLRVLSGLEVELHHSTARSDAGRLNALLHEAFVEYGRSGKTYTKSGILERLPAEGPTPSIWSQDFSVAEISPEVALLTYKSADLTPEGELTSHTLRSSLWVRSGKGWQIWFHQGTATGAFEKK